MKSIEYRYHFESEDAVIDGRTSVVGERDADNRAYRKTFGHVKELGYDPSKGELVLTREDSCCVRGFGKGGDDVCEN